MAAKTNNGNRSNLLFVYGTLKKGGSLHRHLRHLKSQFVGLGSIEGSLYRLHRRAYPAAIPDEGGEMLKGEIYRLKAPTSALKVLDELEGTSEGLFRRELVNVFTKNGKKKAWTYFYARPVSNASRIAEGEYRI